MRRTARNWTNISILAAVHILGFVAIAYMVFVKFSWATLALGAIWFLLCGLGVTGGYHRLFAHSAYRARGLVRALYLAFGAAAVQNSAVKWASDHRLHHSSTDATRDPYNIRRGFWWAHIGWVLHRSDEDMDVERVQDLLEDPLVRLQHKLYVPLAIIMTLVVPAAIASLWGDALGGFLVAGVLRLVIQWHSTFSVNSVAHLIGRRPYSTKTSARDSVWTAFVSLGEGYHNFHHRFQSDYRNGVRWYHFDPTKWFVWGLSRIRLASDLRRVPKIAIRQARMEVREGRA